MTCAHVVADATVGRQALLNKPAPLDEVVEIDFVIDPATQRGNKYAAVAVAEGWRPQRTVYPPGDDVLPTDVAVLRLAGNATIPMNAVPVRACRTTQLEDKFLAYGIKAGLFDGTYLRGEILGMVTPDRVEVVAIRVDQSVQRGCSGTGIWNTTRKGGGLAGMVVEMESETQARIIPVEMLKKVWPLADQEEEQDPRDADAARDTGSGILGGRLSSLLYTFDREFQESDFDAALDALWETQKRPIVCLIAGLTDDLPLRCRDRCLKVPFQSRLERCDFKKAPFPKQISWPGRLPNILARLKQQVKFALNAADPTPEKVRDAFNKGVAPHVFFSRIKESEFDDAQKSAMLDWIDFWRQVGAEPLNKPLAVFLLFELNASAPPGGGAHPDLPLTQVFNDLFAAPLETARALTLLHDFSRDEIEDWLDQKIEELGVMDDSISLELRNQIRGTFTEAERLRLARLDHWITNLRLEAGP
jgi:hypothetical protein